MAGAFGSFVFDVLSTGSTFMENLSTLWEGVKNTFKNVLADMAQEWMEKFLKKIISSALDAGTSIASNLVGGIGKAITGDTGAGGSGIGGLIGAAGGASPAGIIGGIAGGVISGIGSLVAGGKTKGAIDASNRELHNIWIEARELRNDNVGAIIPILTDTRDTLWGISNLVPIADDIKHTSWHQAALLKDIAGSCGDMVSAIEGVSSFQGGGKTDKTGLHFCMEHLQRQNM
ncbi:unnamed protein product [marine sediment metagenome]|uniref:Uncharacterized protein n=1 Tax=marine sediment metagenome TaxID=412755 RepID=X1A2Y6_9ZZZZ